MTGLQDVIMQQKTRKNAGYRTVDVLRALFRCFLVILHCNCTSLLVNAENSDDRQRDTLLTLVTVVW